MDIFTISSELLQPDPLIESLSPGMTSMESLEEFLPAMLSTEDAMMTGVGEASPCNEAQLVDPQIVFADLYAPPAWVKSSAGSLKAARNDAETPLAEAVSNQGKGIFDYIGKVSATAPSPVSSPKALTLVATGTDGTQAMGLAKEDLDLLSPTFHLGIRSGSPLLLPSKRTATDPSDRQLEVQPYKRKCANRFLTVADAIDKAHREPRMQLLQMPRELRDQIYVTALKKSERISLRTMEIPGLLRVNRQVREEALPVYFAINSFRGHLHMAHTYGEALDPAQYHTAYKPATICPNQVAHVQKCKLLDLAIRDVSFDILDKEAAHFATIEIAFSKRAGGSITVNCTEGPEAVAETETWMCTAMKARLVPIIQDMQARPGFNGFTLKDLEQLVAQITISYQADDTTTTTEEDDDDDDHDDDDDA
ncbi:hypothetical protein AAFC00_001067 [Neodothiora populina]|uniref:Uncharacterized protein n=1 Tax=Neodothiora populina TaxID=2781224 RepID=A0ABR3PMQ9_9PEZI